MWLWISRAKHADRERGLKPATTFKDQHSVRNQRADRRNKQGVPTDRPSATARRRYSWLQILSIERLGPPGISRRGGTSCPFPGADADLDRAVAEKYRNQQVNFDHETVDTKPDESNASPK
jgi:hypothetical protein